MSLSLPQLFKSTYLLLSCAAVLGSTPFTQAKTDLDALSYQNDILPLLEEYCYRCHGEDKQKGDIQLSSFHDKRTLLKEHKLWQDVIHVVREE